MAGLLADLKITSANAQLAELYDATTDPKVKAAILPALNQLSHAQMDALIKKGMDDKDESVRTVALGLLDNKNVTKESLPAIVSSIFTKGTVREQQKMLEVLGKMEADKTQVILGDLIDQLAAKNSRRTYL